MYDPYIMRRTQIYLDETQAAALASRARRRGVTASHVIREAIDDYLAEPEDTSERELVRFRDALDRSFAAAPRLTSGSAYVAELRAKDSERATDLETRRRR
jgi:predicted DNA-binding protein